MEAVNATGICQKRHKFVNILKRFNLKCHKNGEQSIRGVHDYLNVIFWGALSAIKAKKKKIQLKF